MTHTAPLVLWQEMRALAADERRLLSAAPDLLVVCQRIMTAPYPPEAAEWKALRQAATLACERAQLG